MVLSLILLEIKLLWLMDVVFAGMVVVVVVVAGWIFSGGPSLAQRYVYTVQRSILVSL